MDLCLEKLGGVVDFPMTLFTEGQFLHLTGDEKIEFFNDILNGKWQKPQQSEGKQIHLDRGNFSILFFHFLSHSDPNAISTISFLF